MTPRLESLDVFRGVAIAAMILVSTPGTWDAVYWPLTHAAWNGWTPTDLVFPFLLFAMGAAVPFAMAQRRGVSQRVGPHVIRRGIVLFALGLVLNAIETRPPAWATFRIPGVLQRIAIVYVAIAWLTERASLRAQTAAAGCALLGYWAIMTLVPVPGSGPGVLTPEGNLASFIDRGLLGTHLASGTWDPEGLLSTVPAVATALFGVFAGDWLKHAGSTRRASTMLAAVGLTAAGIGLIWGRVFPINKSLWTSSFGLMSAGLAGALLATCHWTLDVRRWRGWEAPFVAFGRNPLTAYFLSVALDAALTRWTFESGVSVKDAVYQHAFASWVGGTGLSCSAAAASLLYASAYVAVWAWVLIVMRRRGVFIVV
jgi:predicted acyltransferase